MTELFDQIKQWGRTMQRRNKNVDAIHRDLHLIPGTENLVLMVQAIIERDRIEVPDWITDAVNQTAHLASQEMACALPGHEADLNHGHLLIPPDLRDTPLTEQMQEAKSILFHSQECIDAQAYGLDSAKRNILYSRITGETRILNINDYPHNEMFVIDPDVISPELVEGGTIFFKALSAGKFAFASWNRERP